MVEAFWSQAGSKWLNSLFFSWAGEVGAEVIISWTGEFLSGKASSGIGGGVVALLVGDDDGGE